MQSSHPYYKQKRFWIISLIISAVVFLVVLYKSEKYTFINKKVTSLVADKTDSLYRIGYDSIMVDEVGGNVYLKNLSITGDTILQDQYIKRGDTSAAGILMFARVPSLQIIGFKTAAALLSKELSCNKIIINNPRITIDIYPGQKGNKSKLQEQGKQIYERILGNLKLIQADSIVVLNAEVVAKNHYTNEVKFHTYNTSVYLKDVLIDSLHANDTTRTFFSREVAFSTAKTILGQNPILAEISDLSYSSKSGILSLAGLAHSSLKEGKGFKGEGRDIIITGLQALGSIDALDISIAKARIGKLNVHLEQQKDNKNKSAGSKPMGQPILNGWVKSFSINAVEAGNVSLSMQDAKDKKTPFVLNGSTINISNFKLDTTATMDASLLKKVDDVVINNDLISVKSKDGLYNYTCKGLTVKYRNKTILMKEFAIKPLYSEQAFANKVVVQKDRYNALVNNIAITGVDFAKALNGEVDIDKISTTNNSLKIYRDISKPMDSISKVGNSPHQALYKIKLPIAIKKFIAANTTIEYKERNGLSDTSGSISFAKSTIEINNITNQSRPSNRIMDLKMATSFIGQVPLFINMKFFLDQVKEGAAEITIKSSHTFDGTILNKSIVPMGLLRLDKGTISSIDAQLTTNNLYANGNFTLKYSNLKLTLLKRKKQPNKFNKKDILSLVTNIIVKNNNPANDKLRVAQINFRRDDYKSFFNMVWKFAFTGIKDVLGVKL